MIDPGPMDEDGNYAILEPEPIPPAPKPEKPENPFSRLQERLSKQKSKAPKTPYPKPAKSHPKVYSRNQKPQIVESVLKVSARNQNVDSNRITPLVLLTAQQYAEQEARKHAPKAAELIRKSISDMEVALNVVGEELPFAEGKDVRHLLEGYRAATSEMRKALGMTEDVQSTGPKTLVQIQCVGSVDVSAPDERATVMPELPDLESE